MVLISVAAAAELRVGRTLRGIGAEAATMLEWSTGEVEGGSGVDASKPGRAASETCPLPTATWTR